MKKKASIKRVAKKMPDVHTNDDVKRYMGVLAEHFQGMVSGVAEQFGGLNEKLDSHTKILDSHTEMIGGLMEDVAIIKSDVAFLKSEVKKKVDYQDFAALERRVSLMEAKMRR